MLAARAGFEKAWNKLSATRTGGHFELWRQDRDFHAWKDRMHNERLRCRPADRRDRPLLLRGRDHQRLGARARPDGAPRHKMFTMVSIPKMVALGQSFFQSTAHGCHRRLRPELFCFERSAVAEFERAAISKRTKKALAVVKAKGNALGNYHRIDEAKQAAEAVRPMITETVPPLDASCRRRAKPTRPHNSHNPLGAHRN